MSPLRNIFESETVIRFTDCDPFNHLNNTKFLQYFLTAREDHVYKYHNYDLYGEAQRTGMSWVVGKNYIAYISPAKLQETVIIETTILEWTKKDVMVEMRMWNKDKTRLKALLWCQYVRYNLKTQRPELHSEEMNNVFKPFENPLFEEQTFDERVASVRRKNGDEVNNYITLKIA